MLKNIITIGALAILLVTVGSFVAGGFNREGQISAPAPRVGNEADSSPGAKIGVMNPTMLAEVPVRRAEVSGTMSPTMLVVRSASASTAVSGTMAPTTLPASAGTRLTAGGTMSPTMLEVPAPGVSQALGTMAPTTLPNASTPLGVMSPTTLLEGK